MRCFGVVIGVLWWSYHHQSSLWSLLAVLIRTLSAQKFFIFLLKCAGADWEGVVLVPFIDETRLLAASGSVPLSSLSAAEQAANRHGPALVFASVKDGSKFAPMDSLPAYCKSPFPEKFGDVSPCSTTVAIRPPFPPLPMGQHGFVPELVPGTRVKKGVTGGYPSLASLHVGSECRCAGVDVFGRPSKRESLILSVPVRLKGRSFGVSFMHACWPITVMTTQQHRVCFQH